jgi:hypothetical protein
MPKMIAKRKDVSRSMVLSPCLMRFHRNVTCATVTRATTNTASNSTASYLMFNFHSPFQKTCIFTRIDIARKRKPDDARETLEKLRRFLFLMDFEESILAYGNQPYCSMDLHVGPAFFAFSRPPFAAGLRAAEPLSGADVGAPFT